MTEIFWYDGKRWCGSVWTSELQNMEVVIEALKKDGWKVLVVMHSATNCKPWSGYEKEFEEFKKIRESEGCK